MYTNIFYTLIRAFAVPAVAIYLLSGTALGYQMSFLVVCLVLTVVLLPMIIWQGIKVLPNLALIKTSNVMKLAISIVIEVVALIGYWTVYSSVFS